jgi:Molybdopterin converting factor, small subunit
MSVTVRIPTQLRELSGGAAEVSLEPGSLAEVLAALDATHPGFQGRLFGDDGELRRFVNVFVADEDIRFLDGLGTAVDDGATVSIVPAVAGG